jgi:hypothetical protein
MEDESAKIKEQLLELAKQPANSLCADCGEKDPQWASANLGIFICIVCAGIHRNLGVHISRVKSLMLDIWKPEELEVMRSTGNKKSNEKYEASLRECTPIHTSDSVALREQWIRAKYVRKLYLLKEDTPSSIQFPTMEGYMTKIGDVVKSWRRRIFRLSGSTLFYFKKPTDPTPLGVISMVEATRTPDCLAEPIPDRPNCFIISTPNRDYYLCADSGEAMYDWVQILRTARRYLCTPHAYGHCGKARDVTNLDQVMGEISKAAINKRKVNGKNFNKCLLGAQVVDLLIHTFRLDTRQEGVILGQALIDKGHILSCVPEPFMDGDKVYFIP